MQAHDVTAANRDLADRIAICLGEADELGLTEAGIYLDRALAALLGAGLPLSIAARAGVAELRDDRRLALFDPV